MDLFAGCGGLSLGFEQAGFSPVFACEAHSDAMRTYLVNREHRLGGARFSENVNLRCRDISELDARRLEQLASDLRGIGEISFFQEKRTDGLFDSTLDVLAGGPPCQGFSEIGKRRSYAVDRRDIPSNKLFLEMARVVAFFRPRIFLFENVQGLLWAKWTRSGKGDVWEDVKRAFRQLPGYEVRWSQLHARDYGVPQNRPRVLLVGIRQDVVQASGRLEAGADREDALACGFLPRPADLPVPDLEDLLGDLVDPAVEDALRSGRFPESFETTSYPRDPSPGVAQELRAPPPWEPSRQVSLTEQAYSKHSDGVVHRFSQMLANGGRVPQELATRKFRQRVLPARWGEKGPTITATSLPDDYVHFLQPRVPTVREMARLQLFPDWYRFEGKRTTGGLRRAGNPQAGIFDRQVPKYTQVANAVPVGLARHVAAHFDAILSEALGEAP